VTVVIAELRSAWTGEGARPHTKPVLFTTPSPSLRLSPHYCAPYQTLQAF